MPTKQTTKTSTKSSRSSTKTTPISQPKKSFLSKYRLGTIAVIILLIVIIPPTLFNIYTSSFNAHQSKLDAEDKERFINLKKTTKELQKRFEAADPGVKWHYTEQCQREGVAIGPGQAHCSTWLTAQSGEIQNAEAVKRYVDTYATIAEQESGDILTLKQGRVGYPSNEARKQLENYQESAGTTLPDDGTKDSIFTDRKSGIECALGFGFPWSAYSMSMQFSCESKARDTYFKRSDR